MTDKNDHADDLVAVSPAVVANEVRSTPVPVADDRLRDRDGNPVTPLNSREEVRAHQLGASAAHVTFAERLTRRIAGFRARAAGLWRRFEVAEPRWAITGDEYGLFSQAFVNAAAIPCSTLDPKRKLFSTVPKPGFIVGDTAVMAVVLVRSGTPEWLAILVGFSMALSTVMAGSQFGQMMMLAAHRRSRGFAPDNCAPEHRGFYDDGTADADLGRWLTLGGVTAGALLVSLTLIGVGEGDPAPLAFGFGLLAALTLGGAAAAEAYGTNGAAEYRHDLERNRDLAAVKLTEFEGWASQAAHDDELADVLLVAAEHDAVAAAITVEVTADRTPDNPNIFDYTHPDPPTPIDTFTPRDLPPLDRPPKAPIPPTRTVYRLTNPFSAGPVSTNGKQTTP